MRRIRIAGYVITPILYEDDGVHLTKVRAGPSEVQADKLAAYVVGLQREVEAMGKTSPAEETK